MDSRRLFGGRLDRGFFGGRLLATADKAGSKRECPEHTSFHSDSCNCSSNDIAVPIIFLGSGEGIVREIRNAP